MRKTKDWTDLFRSERDVGGEAQQQTPPRRLLLLEDDVVDRMALRRLVAELRLNYEVTEAATCAEARRRLRAETFDVAVVDGTLPDGSGFDLLPEVPEVPVVFVTGAEDLERAVELVRAGAAGYLLKDAGRLHLKLLPLALERAMRDREVQVMLREGRKLMQQVFDDAPVATLLTSPEGRVLKANRMATELFGAEERLRQDGLEAFLERDAAPLVSEQLRAVAEQRLTRFSGEWIGRDARGGLLNLELHGSRVEGLQERAALCILQVRDLTEMRKLELRERQLESQLQHARKLEAVGTLAGGIAHEFNNRLTGLMGFMQLAQLELDLSHPVQGFLKEAVTVCRSMAALVERMRELARKSEGRHADIDLSALIRQSARAWQLEMRTGVELQLQLADECPPVHGVAEEIAEVLRQVLLNAAFSLPAEGGGVTLELAYGEPPEELRRGHAELMRHHRVCATVRDRGRGMSAEELQQCLNPFFTTRGPRGGPGLGLPVANAIMRRHRGVMIVESAPGVGTTVRLWFPAAAPSDAPAAGHAAGAGDGGDGGAR